MDNPVNRLQALLLHRHETADTDATADSIASEAETDHLLAACNRTMEAEAMIGLLPIRNNLLLAYPMKS